MLAFLLYLKLLTLALFSVKRVILGGVSPLSSGSAILSSLLMKLFMSHPAHFHSTFLPL